MGAGEHERAEAHLCDAAGAGDVGGHSEGVAGGDDVEAAGKIACQVDVVAGEAGQVVAGDLQYAAVEIDLAVGAQVGVAGDAQLAGAERGDRLAIGAGEHKDAAADLVDRAAADLAGVGVVVGAVEGHRGVPLTLMLPVTLPAVPPVPTCSVPLETVMTPL